MRLNVLNLRGPHKSVHNGLRDIDTGQGDRWVSGPWKSDPPVTTSR